MKNKFFSIFIFVTMFFSLYTLFNVTTEVSAAMPDMNVDSFEYYDGDSMTAITNFSNVFNGVSSKTINAKAIVTNTDTLNSKTTTLILVAYLNGKIIGMSTKEVTLDASGGINATKEAVASISLAVTPPETLEGCTIYSYMWNNLDDMEIMSKPAEFGSSSTDLEKVTLCGKSAIFDIEGVSETVHLPVYIGTVVPGDVSVKTKDLTTMVQNIFCNAESSTVTFDAVAASGALKTYTINYSIAEPKLEGISYTRVDNWNNPTTRYRIGETWTSSNGGTYQSFATGNVIPLNVNIIDNGSQTILNAFGANDAEDLATKVTPIYSNPNYKSLWFYDKLPSEFSTPRMKYLAYPATGTSDGDPIGNGGDGYTIGFGGGGTICKGCDEITFKTNKSVRLYYYYEAADYYGFYDPNATSLGSFTFSRTHLDNTEQLSTKTIAEAFTPGASSHPSREYTVTMAYIDCIVPYGYESETFTFKFKVDNGSWQFAPIFYEFFDAENPPTLGAAPEIPLT